MIARANNFEIIFRRVTAPCTHNTSCHHIVSSSLTFATFGLPPGGLELFATQCPVLCASLLCPRFLAYFPSCIRKMPAYSTRSIWYTDLMPTDQHAALTSCLCGGAVVATAPAKKPHLMRTWFLGSRNAHTECGQTRVFFQTAC